MEVFFIMKKKFFAVALATTMALSTAMAANAQSLTSDAWWSGTGIGEDYTLTGNGSVTVVVDGAAAGEGAAFSVEAYVANNGNGHFFTTGSDGNGWFAEAANVDTTVNCPFANGSPTAVVPGHKYEVTVTRNDKDFKMVYNDVTDGTVLAEITGTTTVDFPETINVHVMAQVGTFEVSQKTDAADPAPAGDATTAAPSGDSATTAAPAAAAATTTKAPTSVKTGDVAPVAALAAVAVVACAAVVVSRKKVTE